MQSNRKGGPIRLTNKTASALRKNARQGNTVFFAAGVVMTLALAGLSVYWGMRWLPAVPLVIAGAVLLDGLLFLHARSRYLLFVSQAICTEAAAREIRAGHSEQRRRERALNDLMSVKADAQRAEMGDSALRRRASGAKPFFEQDGEEQGEMQGETQAEEQAKAPAEGARRRRRQARLQVLSSEQAK